MKALKRLTALGRPVDPGCLTNRLILLISLAVLAGVLVFRLAGSQPAPEAAGDALRAALSVFLTWAVGREIDPANDWSAFVGLPASLAVSVLIGGPFLAALILVLLFSRMLNGSTGLQTGIADALLVLSLGAVVAWQGGRIALIILVPIFLIDAFVEPANRRQALFAPAPALLFLLMQVYLYRGALIDTGSRFYALIAIFLLVLFTALITLWSGPDRALDDRKGQPLDGRRVCLARSAAALYVCGDLLFRGSEAFQDLSPVLAAFGGVFFYHLYRRLENTIKTAQ